MIDEHFKQNTSLGIEVFGQPVQVNFSFYWPEVKGRGQPDPLVSHIEYHSQSKIFSETGYRSHFFHTEALHDTIYTSIEELVTSIGENMAVENGYQPPTKGHQMSLFL